MSPESRLECSDRRAAGRGARDNAKTGLRRPAARRIIREASPSRRETMREKAMPTRGERRLIERRLSVGCRLRPTGGADSTP